MLTAAVLGVALAAGVTGAWSPCGFSMVETLAPDGYAGRLRTTLAACLTFAAGALAGGVATFGGLALAGEAVGAGSAALAAIVAVAAAAGEARGARIVPQVRRQVPESWRRVLPVPLAAALYGVLLGLGFTTFVLSFAVWALAFACVALGDPALGALAGLGFGAGRALPVIALAPLAATERGVRAHAAMAERPAIYRGLRAVDAVALLLCALALGAAPARAADVVATPATDPSAAGGALTWQTPGAGGVLSFGGGLRALPGRDPALAPGVVAWHDGDAVTLADPASLAVLGTLTAPGADALAVSATWLVWRAPTPDGGRQLLAARLGTAEPPRVLTTAPAGVDLGRPALDGERAAFHVSGRSGSRIVLAELATGALRTLRRQRGALLLHPSLLGERMVYVRSTATRQQLMLGAARLRSTARDRAIFGTVPTGRRDAGRERGQGRHRHHGRRGTFVPKLPRRPRAGVATTLWTTALDAGFVYVTRLTQRRGQAGIQSELLRVPR